MLTDQKSLHYVFGQRYLNIRQRRCFDLLKEYDISVVYHTDKANIVVDALSLINMGSLAHVEDK